VVAEAESGNVVWKGAILVFLSGVSYAPVAILGKVCVGAGVEVSMLNTIRLGLGVMLLASFAAPRMRAGRMLPRRALLLSLSIGALVYAGGGSLFFLSLKLIDASLAYLLMYTYPAVVVLISAAFGWERVSLPRIFAVLLTFVGVALVLRVGGVGAGDLVLGVLFVMGTTLFFSVYIVISDRHLLGHSPTLISFFSMLGGAVVMFAALPFTGLQIGIFSREPLLLLLVAITALGSVLSLVFFLNGIKLIGASWAAIISTIQPVLVVLLSWAVLGEVMGPLQMLGALLLVGGVMLIRWEKKPVAKTAT